MKFQGAVIKEQGVTFAVVVVKKPVIGNRSDSDRAIQSFQPLFPGIPIVLMAQDSSGVPTFCGRRDIVNFMAKVPLSAVPWKDFSVS